MSEPFPQPTSQQQQPYLPTTPASEPPPLEAEVLSYAGPVVNRGYGLWRQGDRVVATREADFGDACFKCGEPCKGWRWRNTLYWHEPWVFILILFPGILVYAIVALCIRKNAKVSVGLCEAHRKRRVRGILMTWLLSLLAVAALVGGIAIATQRRGGEWGIVPILSSFVLIIVAIIVGSRVRVLSPKKIDAHYAWYTGGGEAFLRTLPAIP